MSAALLEAPDTVDQTVGLMRDAAQTMRSVTCSPTDEIRAVHASAHALLAREAELLAEMDAIKSHEAEGCASVATWAARELNQDVATTRQMVRAAKTMRDLPSVGESARAGRVSLDHVHALTYGLKHVGADLADFDAELTTLAEGLRPAELFAEMRRLKAIAHPDQLDEAWLRGMDKQDIQCLKLIDGFMPTGHVPTDVGAKFQVFLRSASVPRDSDDNRTNAQRRVDAFDDLLDKALSDRLPTECSVRPHLSVVTEAQRLKEALNGAAGRVDQQPLDLHGQPAILEGFGPIGPALLAYVAFGGELTPILVAGFKENRRVLDVGRTERIATKKQRRAILLRQNGRCANRGCHHPIGEIHHVVDWLYGGKTNLDNLAGLCRKCHALVTIGKLTMTGSWDTGYQWSTSRAGPLARTG
ncbi:MAG: DUF222 domain-containing protein [Aeromicrobium sp.]